METPHGIQGTIRTAIELADLHEHYSFDGYVVELENGVIRVGYERPDQEEGARLLAEALIASWGFRHGAKAEVEINQSWHHHDDGNRVITVMVSATMTAGAMVSAIGTVLDAQGNEVIAPPRHPYSFADSQNLAAAAMADPSLMHALEFFADEVTEDDRPLYGIYKALEELTANLGESGRAKLARLANQPSKYLDDVMQTAQLTRHARTKATRKLSDDECKRRAQVLIDAYARSLSIRT